MNVKLTNGKDPDFIHLTNQLDDYLNRLAGGEEHRKTYIPLNALDDIRHVYVLYNGDVPIACAAFKHHAQGTAEVKRVFVAEDRRNKGIAKHLMRLLEAHAKTVGYTQFVLETGRDMPGAVTLYKRLGYKEIPNYGHYKDLPNSICMEKEL